MCTLHTNVSSKTPSRSPQGSAQPVVGGGARNVWQKLNFKTRPTFLSVMIVIGATMKNRIGTALPSLDRLVSIFVELKVLDFLPPIPIPHFLFFSSSMRALPLLETVGAVARPISVYLQLFARQSSSTKGSLRFKW